MRELNTREVEEVSGGLAPAFYGAAHIAVTAARNPAVRSAAIKGAKKIGEWAGAGVVGGASFEGARHAVNDLGESGAF